MDDTSTLSPTEMLASVGGAVLAVASFLPWFTARSDDTAGGGFSIRHHVNYDAWQIGTFWWVCTALTIAAAASVVAVHLVRVGPRAQATWATMNLGIGAVGGAGVILKVVVGADLGITGASEAQQADLKGFIVVSREIGIFAAAVGALIAVAAAAWSWNDATNAASG